MRTAYVNGRYLPLAQAAVHVEDRGYQFADGVYEVIAVVGGRAADLDEHIARLGRSCEALALDLPVREGPLRAILQEVIRRNRLTDGMVYIQVTRGSAPRDHRFPQGVRPALVVTARPVRFDEISRKAKAGVAVHTLPEMRWRRPDIKSVALLPNVLAKQEAAQADAYEAWFVDDEGYVTEGTSSNAWIVDRDGVLRTRPLSREILAGITRHTLIRLAKEAGIEVREDPFTLKEAQEAREAFTTSTTVGVMPVVEIDGRPVANGMPGQTSETLLRLYRQHLATFALDEKAALARMLDETQT